MDERGFREFLSGRSYTAEQTEAAVEAVREFESWLAERGTETPTATIATLKEYLADLVRDGRNTRPRLLDLARYLWHVQRNDLYIYFTGLFGPLPILPSIARRLEALAGVEVRAKVFDGVEAPPLGSPPEAWPPVTALLMEGLAQHLPPEQVHRVLAGNHHGIPAENFARHKEWFREAESLELFLERVHQERVAELETHAREGRVWHEQTITPEVVEFVRANQEILSAVRDGDRLYVTKIPYDPDTYLHEQDPVLKRYAACHCPLARAAILMDEVDVPYEWCYCSGGFTKLMFDTVLEQDSEVELLESVLRGDPRCRFAITISPEAR